MGSRGVSGDPRKWEKLLSFSHFASGVLAGATSSLSENKSNKHTYRGHLKEKGIYAR